MKKAILLIFSIILCYNLAFAQDSRRMNEEIENMGYEQQLDSTLLGRDIYSLLGENVTITQSSQVRNSFDNFTSKNSNEQFNGFRVRIFLDSRLDARENSLLCIRRFNSLYPKVLAFRSYSAPNFKVTAGNFRTKIEAERFLRIIKGNFPDAFIVRDKFKYPSIGQCDTTPIIEDNPDIL